MSVKTKMTAIADKIRGLLGLTGTMGLDTMADNLSAAQEEVDTQAELIAQISSVLSGKAGSGGSANPVLQIKTVTPTKSSQAVKPDSGYDGLSQVNVNAIPSDYIIPSGSKTITANGTFDVTNYASAEVNVPTSGGGPYSAYQFIYWMPETDVKVDTYHEIAHTLGVEPDGYYLVCEDFGDDWKGSTDYIVYSLAADRMVYDGSYRTFGYGRSDIAATGLTGYSYLYSKYITSTSIKLYSNNIRAYFKAGKTYRILIYKR